MKLGEIVVHMDNYNFTKFHQNQMKNKKVLLISRFSVQNFKVSVESWKSYKVLGITELRSFQICGRTCTLVERTSNSSNLYLLLTELNWTTQHITHQSLSIVEKFLFSEKVDEPDLCMSCIARRIRWETSFHLEVETLSQLGFLNIWSFVVFNSNNVIFFQVLPSDILVTCRRVKFLETIENTFKKKVISQSVQND